MPTILNHMRRVRYAELFFQQNVIQMFLRLAGLERPKRISNIHRHMHHSFCECQSAPRSFREPIL